MLALFSELICSAAFVESVSSIEPLYPKVYERASFIEEAESCLSTITSTTSVSIFVFVILPKAQFTFDPTRYPKTKMTDIRTDKNLPK